MKQYNYHYISENYYRLDTKGMNILHKNLVAKKVMISGLDNAGKTSILTALDKKFDFEKEVEELKPTIKVQYSRTIFLGYLASFWDMGGQSIYRNLYTSNKDIFFGETDLLVYVIDIQDREKFSSSLEYLDMILSYFSERKMKVPIIVTFHKYDPTVRKYEEINQDVYKLTDLIKEKHASSFSLVFQQTSIYDIISIVQLISYGLSTFNNNFLELSVLIKKFLLDFDCTSLVLFDERGIIISEFYDAGLNPKNYLELLSTIKDHLFILRRIEEESYMNYYNFVNEQNNLISYLHQVKCKDQKFFLSLVLKEKSKERILDNLPDLIDQCLKVLNGLLP